MFIPNDIFTILSDYYLTYRPFNKGDMEIIAQYTHEDEQFVFAKKHHVDVEESPDLFVLDKNLKIKYITSMSATFSACFAVDSAILGDNRIIFGQYSDTMYNWEKEKMMDVSLKSIEFTFKDKSTIRHEFRHDDIYFIVADTDSKIIDVKVFEGNDKEAVSTINDIIINEKKKFTHINELN